MGYHRERLTMAGPLYWAKVVEELANVCWYHESRVQLCGRREAGDKNEWRPGRSSRNSAKRHSLLFRFVPMSCERAQLPGVEGEIKNAPLTAGRPCQSCEQLALADYVALFVSIRREMFS